MEIHAFDMMNTNLDLVFRAMALTLLPFLCSNAGATVWPVGPGKTYQKPSQVSNLVQDGDTVRIDAGTYVGDVAFWKANELLLQGEGGMAHLDADGKSAGQKAIWVIQGNDVTVEGIAFSHCTVPDKNGAGIRQEGVNLTVRHCSFHHNEMGILAGDKAGSTILVEHSEFGWNGYGDGYSHNIYINHVDRFIFRHNYSHDSKIGHLVKSRAHETFVLYNRLESAPGSGVSYEIDIPNGGPAYLIGNQIFQPVDGENSGLVAYGMEGLSNPGPHVCHAVNNTLVNAKNVGRFFTLNASTALFRARNNLMAGGGVFMNGPVILSDTLADLLIASPDQAGFVDWPMMDFHLLPSSPAIDQGVDPGQANGIPLWPAYEYVHPADFDARPLHGALDIGAYEGPATSGTEDPTPAEIRLSRVSGLLHCSGCLPGDELLLHTLDGRMLGILPATDGIALPDGVLVASIWRKGERMASFLAF